VKTKGMSPRTGRPTNNPRHNRKSYRLSDDDVNKLTYCVEHSDMSETDVVRKGIDMVYQEIKEN
jgi:hypothetical protein